MVGYVFNGSTKIVSLTSGTIILDIKDMYSRWKEWVASSGMNFLRAFEVVGGDPIDESRGVYITSYYFLTNGWRVRPQESSHKLTVINGVLLTKEGADPFIPTIGTYNVAILYSQPVRTETVSTAGSSGPTPEQIASAVWDKLLVFHQLEGSAGKALSTASSGGVDYEMLGQAVWATSMDAFAMPRTAGYILDEVGLNGYTRPIGNVATGTNTPTTFNTNRTDSINDVWKDCLLLFTSGFLQDQVKKVTAYNATTHYITVLGGFTSAPVAGDEFLLLNF
jgi:hypothetical protein